MKKFKKKTGEHVLPASAKKHMIPKKILVNDRMQKGYVYTLTQPMGRNFAADFQPQLTPKEMLALGVFGGVYMRDCVKEFPVDWFARAKFQKKDSFAQDPQLNYFGVNASQPLSVWRKKGWIHPQDPRGWFQWYCRYFLGRRSPDDARQIRRWKAYRRHRAQILLHCLPGDHECRRKQRQSLLHWAYDSRKM